MGKRGGLDGKTPRTIWGSTFDRLDPGLNDDETGRRRVLIEEIGEGLIFDLLPDPLEHGGFCDHAGFSDQVQNQASMVVEEHPIHVGVSLDLRHFAAARRGEGVKDREFVE